MNHTIQSPFLGSVVRVVSEAYQGQIGAREFVSRAVHGVVKHAAERYPDLAKLQGMTGHDQRATMRQGQRFAARPAFSSQASGVDPEVIKAFNEKLALSGQSGIDVSPFLIKPGQKVDLSQISARQEDVPMSKAEGKEFLKTLVGDLQSLENLLLSSELNGILVVLQGMDAAGKSGILKKVFIGNPQVVESHAFKAPTSTERAHDYLWRVHDAVPRRGRIRIFDRSHYEDVIVPLVDGYLDADRIEERYGHIRHFEKMLNDEGILVVKFLLHVSDEEQLERLQERIHFPYKNWKIAVSDWKYRQKREAMLQAYSRMIEETSTEESPWYVVPNDRKWFGRLIVASVMHELMLAHKDEWMAATLERGQKALEKLQAAKESGVI